ncbi:MAG TPA: haloacid dehalogenase type II [Desulfopila sp.]|nr:haloacid dehalogenase type II [Desulfopila sp.]
MTVILGFDVYGTLIDTAGVAAALHRYAGERAVEFAGIWRDKQLEYSFRRALMQNYRPFTVCTREALEYTCRFMGIDIPAQGKKDLMAAYTKLPPFTDALEALPRLQEAGYGLFAFSNGPAEDLTVLLENASLLEYFQDVVSTDEMKSFKPNPAVYAHFLRRSSAKAKEAWLVSGNSFDVIGALSAGLNAAWVKRSAEAVFDPWECAPTVEISALTELGQAIAEAG